MLLTYKFRIYPKRKQIFRLLNNFNICKEVYNNLLELNINNYKETKKSLNKYKFNNYMKGKYKQIHSQVIQNVSDRVHKSFQNFYRRLKDKKCKKKGFPRFKSRVKSITYPQSGFKLNNNKLYCSKLGNIPIKLHRKLEGKIKTPTIKQNKANQYFAIFTCEIPDIKVSHSSAEKVGIDVGIENFATLSNGETIANPRHLIKAENQLKFLQRRLSRKVKGSANRRRARFKVARHHNKIANQRSDFLHKLSRSLALRFSIIAVEDLNVKGMLQNHCLAKHITDASWNQFINMLSYKEVTLGGQCLKNPRTRGSSHRCNKCGFYVKDMPLNKRTLSCPKCLNVCHRDFNASQNHLNDTVGLAGISTPVEILPIPSSNGKASGIMEAGTKRNESSKTIDAGSPLL